jgi:hypothetical protein
MSSIRIVDPGARDAPEFFGIPERRLLYLEQQAKEYLKGLRDKGEAVHMFYLLVKFNEICETPEEMIFVQMYAFTHCRLLKIEGDGITEVKIPEGEIFTQSIWDNRPSEN